MQKGTIARINDLRITTHSKDHSPAHFHVTSTQGSFDVRFTIPEIKFLSSKYGSIKKSDIEKIQDFFADEKNLQDLILESDRLRLG